MARVGRTLGTVARVAGRGVQGLAIVIAVSAASGVAEARQEDFQTDCPAPFDFGSLLMDEVAADAPIPIEVLRCETFVRAQWAVLSDGADALQAMSARVAQGSDELGVIEANRRRISGLIANKQRRREELLGGAADRREPELGQITQELKTLSEDVAALNARILRDFPAYSELSAPSAVDVQRLRSLMRDDEVVVQILVNEDAAYVWAVSHDRIEWRRAPGLGATGMTKAVTELRWGLEDAYVSTDDHAGAEATDEQLPEPAPIPFNRALAHELYADLFGQVEGTLDGKRTLIFVVNGALSAIPLSVLVTAPPEGDDRSPDALRATHWLGDRFTLVALPSLSALVSLRCFSRGWDAADRPAGCPALSESGARSLEVADVQPLTFFGVGDPTLGPEDASADRSSTAPPPIGSAFAGRLADVDVLRGLSPLPGTGRELAAIALHFNAKGQESVLLTADAAREPRILARVADSGTGVRTNADLARARYVSFSTHGLLTGQGGENSEPGLVLTPPDVATEADDGLLAASEAAQLTLRAEFVVLSACNTAASDGSLGAEGLAGLGPAFFYAGARSLLVSHWEVSDDATAELISGTFARLDSGQGRAAALQQSMKAVRESVANPEWAHPNYWAAFSFIGEPGR